MDIFNVTVKRYICPYCGKWHNLNPNHKLGDYTYLNPLILCCPSTPDNIIYTLYRQKECIYAGFFPCMKGKNHFVRRYTNSNLYVPENHTGTLVLVFCATIDKKIYLPVNDCSMCRTCEFTSFCNPIEIAEKVPKRHIPISLGFEFEIPNK